MNKKTVYYLLVLLAMVVLPMLVMCAGCDEAGQASFRPSKPILYVFTSVTCEPCQKQKPVLAQIAATGFFDIVVYEDDLQAIAQFRVTEYPSYIVYINGQEYFRGNDAWRILQTVKNMGAMK